MLPVTELKVGPRMDLDAALMACQPDWRSIGRSVMFINGCLGGCSLSVTMMKSKTHQVPLVIESYSATTVDQDTIVAVCQTQCIGHRVAFSVAIMP